jgi:hypothetical protein
MISGQAIRSFRKTRNFGQRDLFVKVKISYISKTKNERLYFWDYPSEELSLKIAEGLDAERI